jgi:ubiquinone/menaquinone biosynthesis C-methylase UbiE
MRARQVVALGIAAVAGATVVGVHRLQDVPANMRRYSMPSAGIYDLVVGLVFGRRYDAIARAILEEAPPAGTVVDLGSGTGEVLVRLAALAPSLQLTGVDLDADMVARAQRKADRTFAQAASRPRFLVADATALPFANESVDLVVSSYAVHHFPDRHASRAEIMRVLKPGAKAIIWDVVSPHGEPAPAGHHAPQQHPTGALNMVRMLFQVGRIPAERYELRKPGS